MITPIKQEGGTCLPAAIAMVTDTPYDQVMTIANDLSQPYSWDAYIASPKVWGNPRPEYQLLALFGLPRFPVMYSDQRRGSFARARLSGRGVLCLWWWTRQLTCKAGHALAYEDGIVIDPNDPKPMTLREWRKVAFPTYEASIGSPLTSYMPLPLGGKR